MFRRRSVRRNISTMAPSDRRRSLCLHNEHSGRRLAYQRLTYQRLDEYAIAAAPHAPAHANMIAAHRKTFEKTVA